jgi:hypothetical protein
MINYSIGVYKIITLQKMSTYGYMVISQVDGMGDMAFMNGLPAAQERITRVLTNISGNML